VSGGQAKRPTPAFTTIDFERKGRQIGFVMRSRVRAGAGLSEALAGLKLADAASESHLAIARS
jgi:hypothetical protein